MSLRARLDYQDACDLIDAALDTFDFTLPGAGGETLAKDLAVGAAMGIAQRSNAGLDVNGNPFRPNSPDYALYKLTRYDVDRPGELGGQMLSLASLLGEVNISPREVEIVYGTGEKPSGPARNGIELRPSEKRLTDREKAAYFEGGGRQFWGLDNEIRAKLRGMVAEALLDHLRAAGL